MLVAVLFLPLLVSCRSPELEIKQGECQGVYRASDFRGMSGEYVFKPQGKGCKDSASLIYETSQSQGVSLEFYGIKYAARSAPGADDGLVLSMAAPEAKRVSGARGQWNVWTEPFYARDLKEIPPHLQFVLWQYANGEYGAMAPLVGGGMRSIIGSNRARLTVSASSYVSDYAPRQVPMLAIAHGKDPYQVVSTLYAFGMEKMGNPGKLRTQKSFPEVFEYIGWCSWNAYFEDLSEQKILENVASFRAHQFPVGFVLIDAGWLSIERLRHGKDNQPRDYLTSFKANPGKFPNGLAETVRKIKSGGVRYVGVWHTFQGDLFGVLTGSELGQKESNSLMPYDAQGSVPDPRKGRGAQFFDHWYQFLKDSGVDFTKVDNQGDISFFIRDKIPISEAMQGWQQNLQSASAKYFKNSIINCMEMNIDAVYFWAESNVGRSSGDFLSGNRPKPLYHILRNVTNSLWFTQLSYPDYDEFQTGDDHAEVQALLRAMSGGPIYFADEPGKEKFELLWPLVFSDGRILRPNQPALPTRDSLFNDPRVNPIPLKHFARSGSAGLLAAYNVNYSGATVAGDYSPADIYGIAGERFAVYEHYEKKMEQMARSEKRRFQLEKFGHKLWVLKPIERGFAAIGLEEKYISPKAILEESVTDSRARIKLYEGGKFLAYCERKPKQIFVNGGELADNIVKYENAGLALDLSEWKGMPVELEIKF